MHSDSLFANRTHQRIHSPGSIHVVGNTVLDVFVRVPEDLPDQGEDRWGANTIIVQDPIEMTLGGCGAAPAFILGSLGHNVSLCTNIGSDRVGAVVTAWLEEAGVTTMREHPGPVATSVHVVQLDLSGRRRSAYYPGDKVMWKSPAFSTTPDWLLASGYGGVDDNDIDQMINLFMQARKQGTRVVFDPSPWFGERVTVDRMLSLWKQVDGLVGTEEELGEWLSAQSVETLAQQALRHGPTWVVVKRGKKGALYASNDGTTGVVPTEPISGSNSVGAGDTLNGRLVFGLNVGEELVDAVTAGVALATNVVRNGRGVLAAFDNFET